MRYDQRPERPSDCECTATKHRACWVCYAYGFSTVNPDVETVSAYTTADSRGEWFILGVGTIDEMQASGKWLKSTNPVENKQ